MSVYATFTLLCENGREDDKLVKECRRYLEEYVRPLLGNDTFYVEDDRKLFHGHMYYTPPPSAERRAASAIRGNVDHLLHVLAKHVDAADVLRYAYNAAANVFYHCRFEQRREEEEQLTECKNLLEARLAAMGDERGRDDKYLKTIFHL